jgi:hypothetical protein
LGATLLSRRFSGARDRGWIAVEPQWWTAPQGSHQSRHQDNSATSADQLRPPVIHAQLSMMHFVYEIRVTLSTKKSMLSVGTAGSGVNDMRSGPPHRCFMPPSMHYPDMAGFAELK